MAARDQPQEALVIPVTPAPPPVLEEPYSIFDKRQKALIITIVSTAATCTYKVCKEVAC